MSLNTRILPEQMSGLKVRNRDHKINREVNRKQQRDRGEKQSKRQVIESSWGELGAVGEEEVSNYEGNNLLPCLSFSPLRSVPRFLSFTV